MIKEDIIALKIKLKSALIHQIDEQINVAKSMLDEALEAVTNDTKSTAGDKHETSRAMAQIEQEKSAILLAKNQKMKGLISTLKEEVNESIGQGAVVVTNRANFYFSQAMGKLTVDSLDYFCISPSAPIAQVMLGKKKGEKILFNSVEQQILEIL